MRVTRKLTIFGPGFDLSVELTPMQSDNLADQMVQQGCGVDLGEDNLDMADLDPEETLVMTSEDVTVTLHKVPGETGR